MEVEGVREILGNAANSQTAKPGRGEELAARIVEIASRRDLAARLGQENLKRAQEFSVGLMIEAYTNLYTSLLET